LFDPSKYADHDVQLEFLEQELRPYPQLASPFLPALSIIDVMMFNSVDEIRGMLTTFGSFGRPRRRAHAGALERLGGTRDVSIADATDRSRHSSSRSST
jgi:WbqC-like protein family